MSAAEIQNCIESPVHVLQTVGQTVRDFPVKKVVVAERGCRAVAVSAHGRRGRWRDGAGKPPETRAAPRSPQRQPRAQTLPRRASALPAARAVRQAGGGDGRGDLSLQSKPDEHRHSWRGAYGNLGPNICIEKIDASANHRRAEGCLHVLETAFTVQRAICTYVVKGHTVQKAVPLALLHPKLGTNSFKFQWAPKC